MRDYIFLAFLFFSLPISFLRPFYGLLIYLCIGYLNPHRLTWGIAYSFPVAQVTAIATLLGTLAGGHLRFPIRREFIVMFLLWIIFTISSLFSIYPQNAWTQWFDVSKVFLMAFLTVILVDNKTKLKILLLVISLSIGVYGLKGGLFSIIKGGNYIVYGPPDSFIDANNSLGLALVMVIPILWYLGKDETHRMLKTILYVMTVFSIIAAMFTYSRGAFLGLAVIALAFLLKSKKLSLIIAFTIIAILFGSYFVPDKWFERQETTLNYQEDKSAIARLNEWHFAWNVAIDRPLYGGGFNVYSQETYDRYLPEFGKWWDAHSIFFSILAEHGFIALLLFILLLYFCFTSLRSIRGEIKPGNSISTYKDMLQISLLGYIIPGAFLDAAYFDLFYEIVASVVVLKILTEQHIPEIS